MIIPLLLLLTSLPDKNRDLDHILFISFEPFFSFYKNNIIRQKSTNNS